ncbi:Hypothetical protein SRAE_2000348800 [Strongyloides ratti]|uniref:Uncharacterized protein n=1 Tax=Strongyloides ratti TaxID=34506 RepID=A0A090LKY6_STRRB|nr:Hypothetical protein SRAE_2000348800 [Strongyloides ratti]CEF68833.1 Hypothetical protein SRAE_2000348800 [Strongyloides ratti]
MVISCNIKLLVFLLILGIIIPCPVKCYSARFFNDDDGAYKRYLMKYYSSNFNLPIAYQYYYDSKNNDNFPISEFLVKNTGETNKFEGEFEENEVTSEPFESETTKRSLLGNKRNNSLKLKLLNQGARGFGRK